MVTRRVSSHIHSTQMDQDEADHDKTVALESHGIIYFIAFQVGVKTARREARVPMVVTQRIANLGASET